jgi:hypothetical protein
MVRRTQEIFMKTTALLCGLSLLGMSAMLATTTAEAKPGGCLKYGAAGAVAGHYAGHHAVRGAMAGCAAGMVRRHEYKKHMKQEKAMHAKEMHDKQMHDTGTTAPPPATH